jgi:hypothetical protein
MGKPKQPEQVTPQPQPVVMGSFDEEEGGGGGGSSSSSTYGSSTRNWDSGAPISFSGFQDFAKTGGFSASDLANIRARAVSPVRAVYQRAQENVNRQRSLQGGYSPGFGVLQARMARQQGQGISDAATNAEASIAEMVQQGKLSGLQGMAGTEARSSTSDTTGWNNSSSSGGGGGGRGGGAQEEFQTLPALQPEKKKGFWGKLGSGLKKAGQIALPVVAGAFTGGLAAPVVAGLTGAGMKVGQSLLPKSWQQGGQ